MNLRTKVFVALGSNLKNPCQQIRTAIVGLAAIPQTQLIRCSSLYSTPPLPPVTDQPDFINAVAALETTLAPHQLLAELQKLEQQHGRVCERRWGPRTLDLDLLLYGEQIITTSELTIPHAGLKHRNFVLYPLAEIAPDLQLPTGELLTSLLSNHLPPKLLGAAQNCN